MERTDWLDEGLDSADARFLMLTAITHHQFSSPIWGEHEVRKLHAELAELDVLATWAVVDQSVSRSERAGRVSAHLPEPVLPQPRRRRTSSTSRPNPSIRGSTPYTAA
jgi:hypothetical protein